MIFSEPGCAGNYALPEGAQPQTTASQVSLLCSCFSCIVSSGCDAFPPDHVLAYTVCFFQYILDGYPA